MIDLHTHSTASDGSVSPSDLVKEAEAAGLTAIALTDHDTVAGLSEFMTAGGSSPVETIPGVELACSWYGGSLHLVGLFVDAGNAQLLRLLEKIRRNRNIRNRRMLEKLAAAGVRLQYEEIQQIAGGEVVGRPHFAAALVQSGHCANFAEAFGKYIGKNCPGYVRRFLPLPAEALRTIHAAGGVAVWAHPCGGTDVSIRGRIRQIARHLQAKGLDGMEVLYSDYTDDQRQLAGEIADQLGLLSSGGSDYHGTNMPGVRLGHGRSRLLVPDEFLEPLRTRAALITQQQKSGVNIL